MAQPLCDRRLGYILVCSPNPMSTRGFYRATLASLANGSALGVILPSSNEPVHSPTSQLSGDDLDHNEFSILDNTG
jgi:hypothetical protein